MKLLVLDEKGKALHLVLRAAASGHDVRWFAPDTDTGKGFKGFERVENWVASAGWADLIYDAGCEKYEAKLTQMMQRGYPIWNTPCELEFKDYASYAPPTKTVDSVAGAMEVLYQDRGRYVLKGEDVDTYESNSAADMLAHLRNMVTFDGDLLLQDYVEGLQITVMRSFCKDGWMGPVYEGLSHVNMGRVVDQSRVFDETLGKMTSLFSDKNLCGTAIAKCCLSDDGELYVFKVKCGAAKVPVTALPTGDWAQVYKDYMDGKDTGDFRREMSYFVKLETEDPGYPVYGVSRGVATHAHPLQVALRRVPDMSPDNEIVERDLWVTTDEYICIVDGYGASARQAMRRAMGTMEKIYTAGVEPDIEDEYFEDLKDRLAAAQEEGYLTEMVYGG